MNKLFAIVLVLVFFSSLFSQVFESQFLDRSQENSISREQLFPETDNYRDEDELLQFIESTMETHLVPGVSISIVKDGAIVWEKQLGYANIADNIVVDENTMFILSSISKTVTATALMQLFENGLCLPSGSSLSEKDQNRIIDIILSLIN